MQMRFSSSQGRCHFPVDLGVRMTQQESFRNRNPRAIIDMKSDLALAAMHAAHRRSKLALHIILSYIVVSGSCLWPHGAVKDLDSIVMRSRMMAPFMLGVNSRGCPWRSFQDGNVIATTT